MQDAKVGRPMSNGQGGHGGSNPYIVWYSTKYYSCSVLRAPCSTLLSGPWRVNKMLRTEYSVVHAGWAGEAGM